MSVVEKAREHLPSSGSRSIDPARSTVEFRAGHMVIQTVRRRFREFEGAIVVGEGASSVSGTIDLAGLETLNEERVLETADVVVGDSAELLLDIAAVRVD